ncbi:Subtilisin-like protease SBT3.3 [Rhynchospora pubera]|uniref:Subtilisin-like protease SBT3.3 n=1 Tax=Rhynchospora pubera TaxID=906938 RepID=A0AAV8CYM9_9POAL|nr:Subtilisin-like protease SBT3.3 [Rhynchospora pubera]
MPDVISVTPNHKSEVHTTHSWDFLGLDYNSQSNTLLQKGNYGEDIIIGVLDSGIWPESKSFDDTGYGPPPARWKGICQTGDLFDASKINCSNKIIGARWYASEYTSEELEGEFVSPRDKMGHGTHCASTAAGNLVSNASFHGLASGSVRGGAPRARLAIYKVCWVNLGCSTASILAAIDHAIDDGVDVISMSIGGPVEYLGTLHAIVKGIPVVFAAGNNGPAPQSVQNNMPWVISVAASTMDRCDNSTLSKVNITNKIVLCYNPTAIATVLPRKNFNEALTDVSNAGGRGLIYAQYTVNIPTQQDVPYALVDFEIANEIISYISSTSNPLVKISPAYNIVGNHVLAPRVAAFSSRGPNPIFTGILKPDIAAPGVSILAAKNEGYEFDSATVVDTYGVQIKAEATPRKIADPFDYGGGHIDPNKIVDPGLIYDINPNDYTKFYNCTLGLSDECDSYVDQQYQLNAPSIAIPNLKDIISVWRSVTNVGPYNSIYKAFVQPPAGVSVFVEPNLLSFDNNNKVKTFKVTFVANRKVQGDYTFGSLTWSDSLNHSVRIPLAIRTIIQNSYADTA